MLLASLLWLRVAVTCVLLTRGVLMSITDVIIVKYSQRVSDVNRVAEAGTFWWIWCLALIV